MSLPVAIGDGEGKEEKFVQSRQGDPLMPDLVRVRDLPQHRFLSARPEHPGGWVLRGQARVSLGQSSRAAKDFSRALEFRGDD